MVAEHRPALETEAEVAHPTEQLDLATERPHAGMTVMGRHGKSTFEGWMLGSLSERVLRCERCPQLVIY
jgi:nucleotide-binding universal stress UspA family protein